MIGLMVLRSALPGAALAACVIFASAAFAETVSFKADINGIFEIEFHNSGAVLAQLKVVP